MSANDPLRTFALRLLNVRFWVESGRQNLVSIPKKIDWLVL